LVGGRAPVRDSLDGDMTFVHPPTLVTLAIGGALTFWDLLQYERRAMIEAFEDFASIRLAQGSVLDHLEASGIVEVRRNSWGEIVRVTMRAPPSTFAASLLDLGRREFLPPADGPLSNQRFKLPPPRLGRFPVVRQPTNVSQKSSQLARRRRRRSLSAVR